MAYWRQSLRGFVRHLGSIFDIMNIFFGIFLGPLLGCMICTLSKLPVQGRVLIPAMILGCLSGVGVAHSMIANLWVSAFTCGVTLLLAWVGSLLLPLQRR